MVTAATTTREDILNEVLEPLAADMSSEAARALLQIRYGSQTKKRVNQLLQLNSRGKITAEDRIVLEEYVRLGQVIEMIQSIARRKVSEASEQPEA